MPLLVVVLHVLIAEPALLQEISVILLPRYDAVSRVYVDQGEQTVIVAHGRGDVLHDFRPDPLRKLFRVQLTVLVLVSSERDKVRNCFDYFTFSQSKPCKKCKDSITNFYS